MNANNAQRVVRLSSRVYRLMLMAYPVSFRRQFRADMVVVFRDSCREVISEDGWWGLSFLWLHTLLDWLVTAAKQHLLEMGIRKATMIDTSSFDSQLVSNVAYISAALRNGYSIKQAFDLLAKRAPEPSASAFKQVVDSVEGGADWGAAMDNLRQQVASGHLDQVVQVMLKQREEGGNLADKLDTLNESLRGTLSQGGWTPDYSEFE